jgi:hypothetical protein
MPDEKMHTRCSSPRRTDQSRPGTARCLYLFLNTQKRSVRFKRFVLLLHLYPSVPRTKRCVRVKGSVRVKEFFPLNFHRGPRIQKQRGWLGLRSLFFVAFE